MRLTLMDQVDRIPPSGLHLLANLAPTISVCHSLVMLATWRRGVVSSSLLLIGYTLAVLYGYNVLRYVPQALPLAWIAYTWITSSISRASGTKESDGATTRRINVTLRQLEDLADFVAALRDELVVPLVTVLSWNGTVPSTGAVATFLIASWPLWIICVLPRNMWLLPIYTASTTVARIYESEYVLVVRSAVQACSTEIGSRLWAFAVDHAPTLTRTAVRIAKYACEHLCTLLHHIRAGEARVGVQLFPPFPIASLELRHVVLFVGLVALTWCAPWAKLLRMALWRSALIRRTVLGVVACLSGSNTLEHAWRTSKPKVATVGKTQKYETRFEFAIYENQRWWIGLDWTAALLPNERPSWSDSDNNPVEPPAAFSLPRPTRTAAPSDRPSLVDYRVSEWRWTDPEWTVDGAQFITSTVYTPHDTEADEKLVRETQTASAPVLDAADRHQASVEALVDIPGIAHNPVTMSVDNEGWEYGDNTWGKLSKNNGLGRYTRRRRWIRHAVLVQTVEKGVKSSD